MEYNAGFARPTTEDENVPIYIFSAAFDYLHYKEVNRVNGFPYFQFLQCTLGSGLLNIYGREYKINEGTVFLLPANVPHRYIKTCEQWLIDWIVFSGSCCGPIMKGLGITDFAVYENRSSPEIHSIIQRTVNLYHKKPQNRVLLSSLSAYDILLRIRSLSQTVPRTKAVTDFIRDHLADDLPLKRLSDILGVTPEHLCRLFKSEHGMRPFEYINRERIQLAKQLLYETGHSIAEIAHMCGFANENYFREVFKKQTGASPGMYRKSFLC